MGPLINKAAVDKVEHLVADATQNGANIKVGGHKLPISSNGLFYQPTVITNVNPSMAIAQDEISAQLHLSLHLRVLMKQ